MEEKEQSSQSDISSVIRAERLSGNGSDLSRLDKTLVKSPRWKQNALRKVMDTRDAGRDTQSESEQSATANGSQATMHELNEELNRLRQAITRLEAENAVLKAQHELELEASRDELIDLQAAYDQFEEQSDQLLDELDQKYSRLLGQIKHQNPRSLL